MNTDAIQIGRDSKEALKALSLLDPTQTSAMLIDAAQHIESSKELLMAANVLDVEDAKASGKNAAFLDRLHLDAIRIQSMAKSVRAIAEWPSPVGRVLDTFNRPNGLVIEKVAVPIGSVAMIYESRPNVGADASAICLRSGNVVVLKPGKESKRSSQVIVDAFHRSLKAHGLPTTCVQLFMPNERSALDDLLSCDEYIDLVIPRGGRGLVELVRNKSTIPTLLHLDGNCHTYIHKSADVSKAIAIVANAKLRRPGICGATESLVIDRDVAKNVIPGLLEHMEDCEVRGEPDAIAIDSRITKVSDSDWSTEYLDSILSLKIVDDIHQALDFIDTYSSKHTDAIIAEDQEAAELFLKRSQSAIVMHNASTQFADGGEFGFGAEIGISTGKLHARGPVGVDQMTTFKYVVRGSGQLRP